MKKNTNVSSVQEAIEMGYKYAICYRNHYSGNSKGEIFACTQEHAHVALSHFNYEDRGIMSIVATDEDVIAVQALRNRVISLIQAVEYSMSIYSPLHKYSYFSKRKMVFGSWRTITTSTINVTAVTNYNPETFMVRHKNMLNCLRSKLKALPYVSTTMNIIS